MYGSVAIGMFRATWAVRRDGLFRLCFLVDIAQDLPAHNSFLRKAQEYGLTQWLTLVSPRDMCFWGNTVLATLCGSIGKGELAEAQTQLLRAQAGLAGAAGEGTVLIKFY